MSDYRDIYNVKRDIYKHNAQYGTAYIIGLFIEEMAECTAELMRIINHKDFRRERAIEELIDVEIMLDQARETLELSFRTFDELKEKKIRKTAEKLGIDTRKEVVQDEEIN